MITDPMERLIADALNEAGIEYDSVVTKGLDFHLPAFGIYIEVKQFHSSRIAEQMSRSDNVIVAQGRDAVQFLANLIAQRPL